MDTKSELSNSAGVSAGARSTGTGFSVRLVLAGWFFGPGGTGPPVVDRATDWTGGGVLKTPDPRVLDLDWAGEAGRTLLVSSISCCMLLWFSSLNSLI